MLKAIDSRNYQTSCAKPYPQIQLEMPMAVDFTKLNLDIPKYLFFFSLFVDVIFPIILLLFLM